MAYWVPAEGHYQGTRSTFYPPRGLYLDWMQQIYPYVKSDGVFMCPSYSAGSWKYNPPPAAHDTTLGYGINYWQMHYYYYHGMADIKSPSDTIWFADGNTFIVYPSFYLVTYPTSTAYGYNGSSRVQLRHMDGANFAFMDGHVKWMNRNTIESDSGAKGAGQTGPLSLVPSKYWWGRD